MLPGSVAFERKPDDNGDGWIWLEPHIIKKLRYLRPGRELRRRHPAADRSRGTEAEVA